MKLLRSRDEKNLTDFDLVGVGDVVESLKSCDRGMETDRNAPQIGSRTLCFNKKRLINLPES